MRIVLENVTGASKPERWGPGRIVLCEDTHWIVAGVSGGPTPGDDGDNATLQAIDLALADEPLGMLETPDGGIAQVLYRTDAERARKVYAALVVCGAIEGGA